MWLSNALYSGPVGRLTRNVITYIEKWVDHFFKLGVIRIFDFIILLKGYCHVLGLVWVGTCTNFNPPSLLHSWEKTRYWYLLWTSLRMRQCKLKYSTNSWWPKIIILLWLLNSSDATVELLASVAHIRETASIVTPFSKTLLVLVKSHEWMDLTNTDGSSKSEYLLSVLVSLLWVEHYGLWPLLHWLLEALCSIKWSTARINARGGGCF